MRRFLFFLSLFPILANSQTDKGCQKAIPFSKIQVYDGIAALLESGDTNSVCPTADNNLEDLNISLSEGILKIRKIAGKPYEKAPGVRIVYKHITSIEGFGKANIDTKNLLKTDSLKVGLRSGAKFYADFDVKHLRLKALEGALLKAKGLAAEQVLDISTKATFSGFDLEGDSGQIKTTTGGTAKVNLIKEFKGHATTGGQIRYLGTPSIESKTSLGGKILSDSGE